MSSVRIGKISGLNIRQNNSEMVCKRFLKNINELANGATLDQDIPSLNMLPYFHDNENNYLC